jgi:hypothetical protein
MLENCWKSLSEKFLGYLLRMASGVCMSGLVSWVENHTHFLVSYLSCSCHSLLLGEHCNHHSPTSLCGMALPPSRALGTSTECFISSQQVREEQMWWTEQEILGTIPWRDTKPSAHITSHTSSLTCEEAGKFSLETCQRLRKHGFWWTANQILFLWSVDLTRSNVLG